MKLTTMVYHFRKWFFDLNPDETTYIYFFLVEIKFLFFKIRRFTFHYFRQNETNVTRNISINANSGPEDWEGLNLPGKFLHITPEEQMITITSCFPDLRINLTIGNFPSFDPAENLIIPRKTKKIIWFPVKGFMDVSGTINLDRKILTFANIPAYIDHVFSGICPFCVPVHKMYWGRVLHPEIRITYTVAFSAKVRQWSRCFVWMPGLSFSFSEIQLEIVTGLPGDHVTREEGQTYRLIAREGTNRLVLDITHLTTAAGGDFIDPGPNRHKQLFKLLNRISKNPRGEKYISQAAVMLEINGVVYQWDKLRGVDEVVFFGSVR